MNVLIGKLVFISVSILLIWNITSMLTYQRHHSLSSGNIFVNRYEEFLQQQQQQQDEDKTKNNNKLYPMDPVLTESTTNRVESFINSTLNVKGKINVYTYIDICHDYDNYATKWNTLFPQFPATASLMSNFYDKSTIMNGKISRRIIGLLQPDKSDWYSFKIESRMGCELRIIESDQYPKDNVYNNFLLYLALQKEQILHEDDKKQSFKAFVKKSQNVFLHKDKIYMLDVLHAIPLSGFLNLKWKKKSSSEYKQIPDRLLSALYAEPTVTDRLPNVTYNIEYTSRTKYMQQDRRIFFYQTPTVTLKKDFLKACDYKPTYIPNNFPPDHGVAYVNLDKLFPENLLIKHHFIGGSYPLNIEKERAHKIIQRVMNLLGR